MRVSSVFVRCSRFLTVLALAVAGIIGGCDSDERKRIDFSDQVDDAELRKMAPKRDQDVFLFGFDLRASPQEDARQYLSFLKYLAGATGLRFELRFTSENGSIGDDLGKGTVQFAAVGCGSYIQAHVHYGVITLVHGLNSKGQAEYQSVIVVAPDSPIRKIEDLRGKRFAFGGVTSTQGHLIPRIVLSEHGISLDDLAGYEFTGSHFNCAAAVTCGRCDAGGMQDTMGRRLAGDGQIRIIHSSGFYPSSGIAANKDVPHDVVAKVKRALLDFSPEGADAGELYHWERTEMAGGFAESFDEDYAKLRKWSVKFGLLAAREKERK
jgi:phosphonate transport system substrate-binding protein